MGYTKLRLFIICNFGVKAISPHADNLYKAIKFYRTVVIGANNSYKAIIFCWIIVIVDADCFYYYYKYS